MKLSIIIAAIAASLAIAATSTTAHADASPVTFPASVIVGHAPIWTCGAPATMAMGPIGATVRTCHWVSR